MLQSVEFLPEQLDFIGAFLCFRFGSLNIRHSVPFIFLLAILIQQPELQCPATSIKSLAAKQRDQEGLADYFLGVGAPAGVAMAAPGMVMMMGAGCTAGFTDGFSEGLLR